MIVFFLIIKNRTRITLIPKGKHGLNGYKNQRKSAVTGRIRVISVLKILKKHYKLISRRLFHLSKLPHYLPNLSSH